jgi:hypothetical protein
MISQYWIGQIPARPLSILVKNQDGSEFNLSAYTTINVKLLDPDNNEVSLSGATVDANAKQFGQIRFVFPTARSLFEKRGDYVLQLELKAADRLDYTTTHTLRVRELGKVIRNV